MAGVPEGDSVTIGKLKQIQAQFAKERDWDQYHSPRNLLLAMIGEVGELSEIFQWKGEVQRGLPDFKEEEKVHLGEELSDVLLYLVRLSDICGVDLGKAALRKVELNAIKYPAKASKEVANKEDGIENSTSADNGTD
ncbi:putative dCTP diphosphatase [Medicago truncatula]|uniref:dCTP pyrophosphatase 1 n=1 Tax=Medicago truncatula TaxID=3880 RepID=G7KY22_MEDTR|nr:dCTP pyrophosphatase 1 [Medicago truncatula]AES78999.1 MazG nucleotide pyrophosphohydrolase domain protein [Medicago truncatula]RHN45709.1 putative dCTP diphosphatase [Medicago truncatula]